MMKSDHLERHYKAELDLIESILRLLPDDVLHRITKVPAVCRSLQELEAEATGGRH
ncbi:hypothetical protein [Roseibium salinum]|uniref:Uncharacterized protein n=1 Tax=Roseibium salinum TaxID=1604349 RepID=A0ABT3QYQ2_9HYPH|nr:hypothetical protein [Roseibium sp. DSM 29163]MCX2721970.1 hypothetical protein [Roseibium sp. DSM 29163]